MHGISRSADGAPGRRMKRILAALLVPAASLRLLACVGGTDPATNVRSTHATLNAHGYPTTGRPPGGGSTTRCSRSSAPPTTRRPAATHPSPTAAAGRPRRFTGESDPTQRHGVRPDSEHHLLLPRLRAGHEPSAWLRAGAQLHDDGALPPTSPSSSATRTSPTTVGAKATVTWATDRSSTTGRIKYGQVGSGSCTANTVSASRTAISVNNIAEYQWRATLSNLVPGAKYCYRVELGNSRRSTCSAATRRGFDAQLPAGLSEPFSFAVLGDWGAVGDAQAGANNRGPR